LEERSWKRGVGSGELEEKRGVRSGKGEEERVGCEGSVSGSARKDSG
jgi:hypothetical protein